MFRPCVPAAATVLLVLVPVPLLAGGPARLCLPIAGLTEENTGACADLLRTGLQKKLLPDAPRDRIAFQHHHGQGYALLSLNWNVEVRLSDVEAALAGSPFSVPRDRLRLFGPVQLHLQADRTAQPGILDDLKQWKHAELQDSQQTDEQLVITMLLPADGRRSIVPLVHGSLQANAADPTITGESLPRVVALQQLVAGHGARLNDIGWSGSWTCRVVGCVAIGEEPVSLRR
jgi:hypothetical protein